MAMTLYLMATTAMLFLVGCSTKDMPEGVNHVHVGPWVVDLTFGPITTIVMLPFILWGVKVIVTRILKKRDAEASVEAEKEAAEKKRKEKELEEKKTEAIRLKAQIDQERHDALQKLILDNRELVAKKLDRICERYEEQEKRFGSHWHNVENGRTKEIFVKLDV